MSVKVDLADIATHVSDRGAGYIVTTGPDGRPHVTQEVVEVSGSVLRAPAGRKTCRNIAAQPLVAVMWPPKAAGDYSLIVDGSASVVDLDDEETRKAEVSAAKLQLTDSGWFIQETAIQLFGGIGVTDEQDEGLFFKRLRCLQGLFGDGDWHVDRFQSLKGFDAVD